jgi:hydroxymethylbilane synthase
VRVRILSRGSALARLQAALVERALAAAHPGIEIECTTRASAGDRDLTSPLWKLTDKGAFTADLSDALRRNEADIVVHSFKDLPIELPAGTRIAGALPRADARDMLLMRRQVLIDRPSHVSILSSSPRRAWLLNEVLPSLLPWPVAAVDAVAVRGNIETRVRRLVEGGGHGLVVAKAAIDRLLGFGAPYEEDAARLRDLLAQCHWMVMPMREFPWAPAQGAIAMEVAAGNDDLEALLAPVICRRTTDAVEAERQYLAEAGGGCHQALGAAVVTKPYGRIVSLRSKGDNGSANVSRWVLEGAGREWARVSADRIWPAPGQPVEVTRRPTEVAVDAPDSDQGLWVARSEALPTHWQIDPRTFVWAAGTLTRQKLAARGVWVHGSADSLGDEDCPPIDALAGRRVPWLRLTHAGAAGPNALPTYVADTRLPDDLPSRSHFYWMSGEVFTRAIERWPSIADGWHASGPGRTRDAVLARLADPARAGVWLDRESWERDICL